MSLTNPEKIIRVEELNYFKRKLESVMPNTMGASGSGHKGGLVPDTPSTAGTTKFLREDGTWNEPAGGSAAAYTPTLQSAPTSSTTTYTKDGQTVDFEVGQFARVANANSPKGYDMYQLYNLATESNVTTATWVKMENEEVPSNIVLLSSDNGEGIVPEDGVRAESVNVSTAISVNPDVLTVVSGAVGGSATTVTFVVPTDNLAHVWDIMMTTASIPNVTFVMSNNATIKVPNSFSLSGSKSVEISVIGVGSDYYLQYGEFN